MYINAAIGADAHCAGVVQGGGVQAKVFQRAAEADEEFALVAINGGQCPRRVGQDGDAVSGGVKTPGLAVVSGRCPGGGCDQLTENGVVDVHGATLFVLTLLIKALPQTACSR